MRRLLVNLVLETLGLGSEEGTSRDRHSMTLLGGDRAELCHF
jgi:hypothetical protein